MLNFVEWCTEEDSHKMGLTYSESECVKSPLPSPPPPPLYAPLSFPTLTVPPPPSSFAPYTFTTKFLKEYNTFGVYMSFYYFHPNNITYNIYVVFELPDLSSALRPRMITSPSLETNPSSPSLPSRPPYLYRTVVCALPPLPLTLTLVALICRKQ